MIHTTNKPTELTQVVTEINGLNIYQTKIVPNNEVVELKLIYENEGRFGDIDPRAVVVQFSLNTAPLENVFADQIFNEHGYYTDEATNKRVLSFTGYNVTLPELGTLPGGTNPVPQNLPTNWLRSGATYTNVITSRLDKTELVQFPLENIDEMQMDILADVRGTSSYEIDKNSIAPFGLGLKKENGEWCKLGTQEGLAVKTYQSDKFNNWINTEWIDGTGGVSEVTAVDTSGGSFTIDALSLANKVYKMLNRINMSGGSYNDWINAVYSHEAVRKTETPVYHGSLIKELAFEEVVSTAEIETEANEHPLGTLAGRGKLTGKHKGGKMVVKCHEPCYVMGIASITPRLDYSQGNKWDVNLKTLDDLHKPDLDQIGFQDLITDEMAWFDTQIRNFDGAIEYNSVGKVPAWLNYMTAVNQTKGNFANENKEMFMTLNRKYEAKTGGIKDITTYIDPSKFNHIFADTNLDSQNFWTQISVKNTARRKMSAKVIPNL